MVATTMLPGLVRECIHTRRATLRTNRTTSGQNHVQHPVKKIGYSAHGFSLHWRSNARRPRT